VYDVESKTAGEINKGLVIESKAAWILPVA